MIAHSTIKSTVSREKFVKAAYIIKAIAHPKRLAIIEMLHTCGRACVTEIVETLQCEQSCISHHLVDLKLRGLLNCEREGQQIFYWLREPEVVRLIDCVGGFNIHPPALNADRQYSF